MAGDVAALAQLAPGPVLASALAAIDLSTVDCSEAVALMRARARQVACAQAELLADIAHVAHLAGELFRPGDNVRQEAGAAEVAAALAWTSRAAHIQLDLAQDVTERWPVLHAAMLAGELDVPRARVICDVVRGIDGALAAEVIGRILPLAGGLTTAQIGHRLRRLIAKADPVAAERRRRTAIRERTLWHHVDRDGVAGLGASGLPVARAAAAEERISAIAKAARAAGDPRTLAQLRVDTFLDLLEGKEPAAAPGARKGVVELTVPLATLMGSDDPGRLAGWGPVPADVARQVAAQQTETTWRLSIYDSDGILLSHVTARGRRFVVDLDRPVPPGDPSARRPDAATARFVGARDRTCRFRGCLLPAQRIDLDHTIPHAEGGPTTIGNLEPLCRSHHVLKHRGWRLRQTRSGHFIWRSPLGQIYHVNPDPP